MTLLPFPDQGMVEVAADAVMRQMRACPHLYAHSLRYLPKHAQRRIAERVARAALYSAWLQPNQAHIEDFRLKMKTAAHMLAGPEQAEKRRWCPTCKRLVLTSYKRCAVRCTRCGSTTRAAS